jgi:hypothetical protein
MSITSETFISEMKELRKLIQDINRAADILEAGLWSLGDLQRHVDISIEVMRLRAKAKKFDELFYSIAATEILSKINYIFSRSPNARTSHIIDQIFEEWFDAKMLTRLEEKGTIVDRVYNRN